MRCIQCSEGNFKFVADPARIEGETGLRLELRYEGMLDQLGAKASTGRSWTGGPPFSAQISRKLEEVSLARLVDIHPPRGARERPVFYGVRA